MEKDKHFLYGGWYSARYSWMRLGIHLCDDSIEARELRKAQGKKTYACASEEDSRKYFSENLHGLDLLSYSENLGKNSGEIAQIERTTEDYGINMLGNIRYKDIYFNINELVMEDHWLVSFLPSFVQKRQILKYNKYYLHYKPYYSDLMNRDAINHKDGSV